MRQAERTNSKGKERDPAEGPGLPSRNADAEEIGDEDYDLFNPPPLPPNPSGPQIRMALRKRSDAAMLQAMLHTMDVDSEHSAGQSSMPTHLLQQTDPSSCPQLGTATEMTL